MSECLNFNVGSVVVAGFSVFDGTTQSALYAMAAFMMVAEPMMLRRAAQQLFANDIPANEFLPEFRDDSQRSTLIAQ